MAIHVSRVQHNRQKNHKQWYKSFLSMLFNKWGNFLYIQEQNQKSFPFNKWAFCKDWNWNPNGANMIELGGSLRDSSSIIIALRTPDTCKRREPRIPCNSNQTFRYIGKGTKALGLLSPKVWFWALPWSYYLFSLISAWGIPFGGLSIGLGKSQPFLKWAWGLLTWMFVVNPLSDFYFERIAVQP